MQPETKTAIVNLINQSEEILSLVKCGQLSHADLIFLSTAIKDAQHQLEIEFDSVPNPKPNCTIGPIHPPTQSEAIVIPCPFAPLSQK